MLLFGVDQRILRNRLSVNQGMFFENMIAQILTAKGYKLYYYNHYDKDKHRNDIEIDFLTTVGGKISGKLRPIEVKASKNYTTISLNRFMEHIDAKRIEGGYVIHPKGYYTEDRITYLPAYMAFCL